MAMDQNLIRDMGTKLGVRSPRILRKAVELYQMMDVRMGSASLSALKLTGSCRVVACLDLAASVYGCPVDRSQAVKLSGMNKKLYTNTMKAVESMLDLQQDLTIQDLGVQFGCTSAVSLAQQALASYQEEYNSKSCSEMNFTSSLFQAAALCAACRKLKVKIDKTKLQEVCSVKRTTFETLVIELEKHAEKLLGKKKITSQKRPSTFLEEVEKKILEEEMNGSAKQQKTDDLEEKFSYEDWKRKILEAASKSVDS